MRLPGKVKRFSTLICDLSIVWLASVLTQFLGSKILAIEFRIDSWPVHRLAAVTVAVALIVSVVAFALYSKYGHAVTVALTIVLALTVIWWGLGRYDLEFFGMSSIYTNTVLQNTTAKSAYMPTTIIVSIFVGWFEARNKNKSSP